MMKMGSGSVLTFNFIFLLKIYIFLSYSIFSSALQNDDAEDYWSHARLNLEKLPSMKDI